MKRAYTLILAALATIACLAAAPQKKTKKAAASTAATHKVAARTASRTIKGRSTTSSKRASTVNAKNVKYVRRHGKLVRVVASSSPAPSYQLRPDPERYQQIQQALADKGYFKGEVNGEWGDDSVDALRRFQMDQKLDGDGHLTALSLTNLGLGPKHNGDISTAPAPAAPALTPVSTPVAVPPVKPPDLPTKQ